LDAPEKQQRSEGTVAGAMPTKRSRRPSKPSSAAHNNLDASSLHLLPRFAGIISRIENETLQAEARVALQDLDNQMDAAMELVEDGKRLVSEGESNIKDAHRNVCSALTRLFEGAYDLGSPSDIRARCRSAAKSGATPEVSPFSAFFFFASLLFLLIFH
jgi:chemotaxis protein histidine kinase CheA